VFHVASVSCLKGMSKESWGHGLGARGRGATSQVPVDEARGAPRVLWTGRARPHIPTFGSRMHGEREEGSGGKSGGTRRMSTDTRVQQRTT
jgi:hypothetical protein